MQVIAHRGFAATNPENTVAAVRTAARTADAVEFDVRRCGSGELVVVHDAYVDRVTERHGRVRDFDLDTLQSLSVQGSDEPIPTLSAVLRAVPSDVGLNVELKEAGLVPDVLDVLASHEGRVVCSSFSASVVSSVRHHSDTVDTAYISMRLQDRPVATARRLGCTNLHLQYGLCFVPGLVALARRHDLTVNAWTPEGPAIVGLLETVGVDGVTVDSPGVVGSNGIRGGEAGPTPGGARSSDDETGTGE